MASEESRDEPVLRDDAPEAVQASVDEGAGTEDVLIEPDVEVQEQAKPEVKNEDSEARVKKIKKQMKNMSRKNLIDLATRSVCEAMSSQSSIGALSQRIDALEAMVAGCRDAAAGFDTQISSLTARVNELRADGEASAARIEPGAISLPEANRTRSRQIVPMHIENEMNSPDVSTANSGDEMDGDDLTDGDDDVPAMPTSTEFFILPMAVATNNVSIRDHPAELDSADNAEAATFRRPFSSTLRQRTATSTTVSSPAVATQRAALPVAPVLRQIRTDGQESPFRRRPFAYVPPPSQQQSDSGNFAARSNAVGDISAVQGNGDGFLQNNGDGGHLWMQNSGDGGHPWMQNNGPNGVFAPQNGSYGRPSVVFAQQARPISILSPSGLMGMPFGWMGGAAAGFMGTPNGPMGGPPVGFNGVANGMIGGAAGPRFDWPSMPAVVMPSPALLPALPPAPNVPSLVPGGTLPPTKPLMMTVSSAATGITLVWTMPGLPSHHDAVVNFELFSFQASALPFAWQKVSDVMPQPVPMAYTVTQVARGNAYYFIVRAVDVYGRVGPFSDPKFIEHS